MTYVIKDTEDDTYWIAGDNWSSLVRRAEHFNSKRLATDIAAALDDGSHHLEVIEVDDG